MSEQNPPTPPNQGDDPTQAYTAYSDDGATRMERPVQPYGEEVPSLYASEAYGTHTAAPHGPGIVAPLVTVALLAILAGIGIGYMLFHDTGSTGKTTTTTSTTATSVPAVVSTTTSTTEATTSTAAHSTSTTSHATSTTTTEKSSTTSSSVKSSTSSTAHTTTTAVNSTD